jgi:hypothetical protein
MEDDEYSSKNIKIINIRETKATGGFYAVFGYVLYFILLSFILININIVNGYPTMRNSGSPGNFFSSRYGYMWGMCFVMAFNLLNPTILLFGMSDLRFRGRLNIHFVFLILLVIANVLVFISLSGIWIAYCNNDWGITSICTDPKACCNFYTSPNGITFCANTENCSQFPPGSSLMRTDAYFLLFLWSLFFGLYTFFGFAINKNLSDCIVKPSDLKLMIKNEEQDYEKE